MDLLLLSLVDVSLVLDILFDEVELLVLALDLQTELILLLAQNGEHHRLLLLQSAEFHA